ncbi:hypothetical protein M5689_013347 [Euphorbia peplus]|nr:hypothetical protein M5689_013347 [Euphorbia peplus]
MSVSVEAMAMAGMDYEEWGMDFDEFERQESQTPAHLLAEDEQEEKEEQSRNEHDHIDRCSFKIISNYANQEEQEKQEQEDISQTLAKERMQKVLIMMLKTIMRLLIILIRL